MHVTLVDGVPTIPLRVLVQSHPGQGPRIVEHDQPLELVKIQRKNEPPNTIVYTTYAVPRLPHFPRRLQGLTVSIRQNSTPEEIEAKKRRTRALRIYAENVDPRYNLYFGVRKDPDSTNNHYKASLINRRAGSVGKHRYKLDLLAYQATTIITSIVAHHKHTGADTTAWFGQHRLNRKYKIKLV